MTYREQQLQNARLQTDAARSAMNTERVGSRKWRDAVNDLEFWTNKSATLASLRHGSFADEN
jgi:hypothetical protein